MAIGTKGRWASFYSKLPIKKTYLFTFHCENYWQNLEGGSCYFAFSP